MEAALALSTPSGGTCFSVKSLSNIRVSKSQEGVGRKAREREERVGGLTIESKSIILETIRGFEN